MYIYTESFYIYLMKIVLFHISIDKKKLHINGEGYNQCFPIIPFICYVRPVIQKILKFHYY